MNKQTLRILLALFLGVLLGAVGTTSIVSESLVVKLPYSEPLSTFKAVTPFFEVTLQDKVTYKVKVSYTISAQDSIPSEIISARIIDLAKVLETQYVDGDVYLRNLYFHLNDKIAMMTGSKRFSVRNIKFIDLS